MLHQKGVSNDLLQRGSSPEERTQRDERTPHIIFYPAQRVAERNWRPVGRGRRVLIVDDNTEAASTLAELVSMWGHNVWYAFEGYTGLEEAREHQPDVVVLDICMPRLDGYEVARRLRADPVFANTTLVALTAFGRPEDRARAMQAGFHHFMTKPADLELLRSLLVALPN